MTRHSSFVQGLRIVILLAAVATTVAWTVAPRPAQAATPESKYHVYIGTYTTKQGGKGIYRCEFDAATGQLSAPDLAAEVTNSSFINLHPSGRFLYSVSREGKTDSGVLAFAIDAASGKLTPLGGLASCGGSPCYVAVDQAGKCVLTADYGTGIVAALPIQADGSLSNAACMIKQASPAGAEPKNPHAHSINASLDNRFAVAADLGLNELLVYRLDAEHAQLTPVDPPFSAVKPGSGPRHFTFHPGGKFAYSNMETSNQAIAFAWDAQQGRLTELQTLSTLPADFTGKSYTAEIQTHPNGRFVYVSNRGHNSIAIFACDPDTGLLSVVGHQPTGGKTPRNFRIDPSGRWMLAANQDSNNVVVFAIDDQSGKLSPTGQSITLGSPVCVKFLAAAPAQ